MTDAAVLPRRRQWLIVAAIFSVVVALLGGGYYLFLREGYSVLAAGIRPGEAAAVVAELDKRGTAYRLRDGGTTILVAAGEADATRLAIVRSDAAATGQIGFELFNKSDMGLTNFAQKINYQRALQGELVRTIMAMDGVESARVHLALPERTLFRDDRTEPSAAVTIAMRAGQVAEATRIAGIQRLVAAAVPDLPASRVVVLDAEGRTIGQASSADAAPRPGERPAALEARKAIEQYYAARARGAIEASRVGLRHQIRVLALPEDDPDDGGVVDPTRWFPGRAAETRGFRLRLTLMTEDPLDADSRAALAAAVGEEAGLDAARGDVLLFETGPTEPTAASLAADVPGTTPPHRFSPPVLPQAAATSADAVPHWAWVLIPALLAAWLLWRRSRAALRPTLLTHGEHEAFAQTLRRRLALTDDSVNAAR